MTTRTQPVGPAMLTLASLVGFGLSLYYYLTPMTGVTGTQGALLVVISSLLLMLAGIVLFLRSSGFFVLAVRVLALLGALGTMAAAYFLHEFWLMAAMVVALVGVIIDFASVKGGSRR